VARQLIDLPTVFTPLPYGLWDSIQTPSPGGPHWQNGVTWVERCPAGDTTYDECIAVTGTGEAAPAPPAKTPNVTQDTRGALPFTVIAEFQCTPVGLGDAQNIARDALTRVEQQQVETAFWTGTAAGQQVVFPHLAGDTENVDGEVLLQPVASPVVTGADAAHALGLLEQELADCYKGQGLIHVPPSALPTLAAWKLARLDDASGRLVTPSGNLIVAGGGYTGSGPDGAAPAEGTSWIYATGAAWGYRSDVYFTQVRDSLDRSSNTLRMQAERTYLIGFECCLLAAHIALGVPTE
jgi:hypothetical protein